MLTDTARPSCRSDRAPRAMVHRLLLLLLAAAGCDGPRFAHDYDQRAAALRRIAIIPSVEMYSRHTGDVLERRPDLDSDVSASAGAILESLVSRRGAAPRLVSGLKLRGPESADTARHLALIDAVVESIVTHHYQFGHAREIDYPAGDTVHALAGDDADAILFAYVKGVVPTSGRQFLQGAALAIGAFLGSYINISTNETVAILILVDRDSGQVLWFNMASVALPATSTGSLRTLLNRATRGLSKPQS